MSIIFMPIFIFSYTYQDIDLMYAQEEFVIKYSSQIKLPNDVLLFGSPKWKERDAASQKLYINCLLDISKTRYLFQARHSKDKEIGLRANNILRKLSGCIACKGLGISKNWQHNPCSDCGGMGNMWHLSPWD